jgi:AcrR family transcriptional regulator
MKTDKSPRKLPRQRRAKQTVDAILEATAHILTHEGYDAVNTNLIAERAGVSIGSLYQYFPNKEALFAALKTRHELEMFSILESNAARAEAPSLDAMLRAVVSAVHEAHERDPALHSAIETSLAHLDDGHLKEELALAFERQTRKLLDRHKDEIRRPDLALATRMALVVVESVMHEVVGRTKTTAARRKAVDELIILLTAYLRAAA